MTDNIALMRLTTDIVTRALSAHKMPMEELTGFISGVHNALYTAANPAPPAPVAQAPKRGRKPKVSAKIVDAMEAKTIMAEEIITDDFEEVIDENELTDEENIIGEITVNAKGEHEVPKRPAPMFED